MTSTYTQPKIDNIPFIHGLSDVADRYDAFVLDIYGVIHNGVELFPGTIDCLQQVKDQNKPLVLLSNTPSRDFEIRENLTEKGLSPDLYSHIVTAGDSAYADLKRHEGQTCWFAGTNHFYSLLDGLDITPRDTVDGCDFILNAISGRYTTPVEHIRKSLDYALTRDMDMVCANPDMVVMIGQERQICAGTYAQYYEDKGGKVTWHGKPHAPVYETVWDYLGQPDKSRVLAVGDSLRTDIQGANNFGFDSLFNLTGIHWDDIALDHTPEKADIDKVMTIIQNQPHHPTAIMGGLKW